MHYRRRSKQRIIEFAPAQVDDAAWAARVFERLRPFCPPARRQSGTYPLVLTVPQPFKRISTPKKSSKMVIVSPT